MCAVGLLPGSHSDPGVVVGTKQESAFLRLDLLGSPLACPVFPAQMTRLIAELRKLRLVKLHELDKILHKLCFKLQRLPVDLLKLLVVLKLQTVLLEL